MKKLLLIVTLCMIASPALANDFCKQRVVEKCDLSGTNCRLVVVCD